MTQFYHWQNSLSRVEVDEVEVGENAKRENYYKEPQNKKIAVFFDVDNTLINGQTQKMMVSYFYQKKKINLFFLLKIYIWFLLYKLSLVSKGTSLMEKAYSLVKGLKIEEFKNFMEKIFNEEIKLKIYPQAFERINFHKEKGHEVILVSKSCQILIDIIKDYLKLPLSIATELEIENEVLTGKIKGNIIYGQEKLKTIKELALKKEWDLKTSYSYGDHYSDLPLLRAVKYPAVVNPNRKLKKEAKKYNWPIYLWKL